MVVEVDIAKLQARVKELYKDGNASNQEKIQEISRKARSPGNLVISTLFIRFVHLYYHYTFINDIRTSFKYFIIIKTCLTIYNLLQNNAIIHLSINKLQFTI